MRLIEALKKKYKTPQQVLEALALDVSLLAMDSGDSKEKTMTTLRELAKGQLTKGDRAYHAVQARYP